MIAVGVDTHKHRHVAVAVSQLGLLVGEIAVAANAAGYGELVVWLAGLGGEAMVGIEGAGSYGAGLCRHLEAAGISVVEVERPRRRDRRQGKSDRVDALLAAKRVLAGDGISTPRAGGIRSALSVLLVAYRSCVEERTGCSTSCRACTSRRQRRCASGSATATERAWLIAWCGCATGPAQAARSRRC
jgi:transposase